MNLYEIKEKVIESKKAVFSTIQLSKLISKSTAITNVYISRLVKKKLAKRIHGKVIFTYDDNVIATQFMEPAYVSLSSALFFHQVINQVPTTTLCVTTVHNRYYKDMQLKYQEITPKLFFGFKKYSLDNSYAYIADPEKAILDGIYYKIYTKEIIKKYKPKLNWILVKKYSKSYPERVKKVIKDVD
ncbi:MAG: hypothetical protein WCF78_03335 [archaeon]